MGQPWILFAFIGVLVLIAVAVLAVFFFLLDKEVHKDEQTAVPFQDLSQFKKDLSSQPKSDTDLKSGIFDFLKPKSAVNNSEGIVPYESKVSLPLEPVQIPIVDDTYKKRAVQLEEELKAISKIAENQSAEAKQMIESLSKENDSLKMQKVNLEQAQLKLSDIQQEASGLKIENSRLQTQLEITNSKVSLLEDQMAVVKLQMGEEISRANATVSELTREKEALLSVPKLEPDVALRQELESLNAEHGQLKQKCEDLERTAEKLRELNAHLIEKNELMQYELIKARAQSSGLERVSYNYKNQLEDFLKKVNSFQVTNDHLAQVKNRLEGVVELVKLENEDLLKKDQLAQFELEKNRSRLISLEREYEALKVRIQQQNQQ